MLERYSTDPHGIGKQTLRQTLPRLEWFRRAHDLAPHVGNVRCPDCQAEFDFLPGTATLKLLTCNTAQFAWADTLKGQTLSIATWYLRSAGKRSDRPGWLCNKCSTEFDTEDGGLRLVQSTASAFSQHIGQVLSLTDWQRLGAGVPTKAEEATLHQELVKLQEAKQQEEAAFRRHERDRLAMLKAELATLVKQSILSGFLTVTTGTLRLPLNQGEAVRWESPATKLKLRCQQGQSFWDGDGEGTLFVTTQRLVFATPDAKRWQKSLSKLHTVQVEHLGVLSRFPILVLGFDGLQNPVAFQCGELHVTVPIHGYPCSVTLTENDLANMLGAHLR